MCGMEHGDSAATMRGTLKTSGSASSTPLRRDVKPSVSVTASNQRPSLQRKVDGSDKRGRETLANGAGPRPPRTPSARVPCVASLHVCVPSARASCIAALHQYGEASASAGGAGDASQTQLRSSSAKRERSFSWTHSIVPAAPSALGALTRCAQTRVRSSSANRERPFSWTSANRERQSTTRAPMENPPRRRVSTTGAYELALWTKAMSVMDRKGKASRSASPSPSGLSSEKPPFQPHQGIPDSETSSLLRSLARSHSPGARRNRANAVAVRKDIPIQASRGMRSVSPSLANRRLQAPSLRDAAPLRHTSRDDARQSSSGSGTANDRRNSNSWSQKQNHSTCSTRPSVEIPPPRQSQSTSPFRDHNQVATARASVEISPPRQSQSTSPFRDHNQVAAARGTGRRQKVESFLLPVEDSSFPRLPSPRLPSDLRRRLTRPDVVRSEAIESRPASPMAKSGPIGKLRRNSVITVEGTMSRSSALFSPPAVAAAASPPKPHSLWTSSIVSVWDALIHVFFLGGFLSALIQGAGRVANFLSIGRTSCSSESSIGESDACQEDQLWVKALDDLDKATRELKECEVLRVQAENRVALAHSKVEHMRATKNAAPSTEDGSSQSKRNNMVHTWCVSGRFA